MHTNIYIIYSSEEINFYQYIVLNWTQNIISKYWYKKKNKNRCNSKLSGGNLLLFVETVCPKLLKYSHLNNQHGVYF